ncbi:MAG: isoleucine--tRNA ligase [Alphaproteobacteria bacterium]|nr:isoleucine--tRNA ligase [Alphaproteobacteria bacterium]
MSAKQQASDRSGSDYRPTVFLPKTDFPMRAGLPKREPELLERWARLDLYTRLREASKGHEAFILHDGPPYANGNIHIGTALNKILKDVVNRSQQMMGKDANYVPGWDCHGLPIEWQVEQMYRDSGRDKDEVPIVRFRQECREFAEKWIGIQSREFQRLGVLGDWKHPYATMHRESEAVIAGEICRFLMNGGLYKGSKPVMWSVVEKTALAEAEIEYHDHVSTTVYVRFRVLESSPVAAASGASIVIWTTTPWTMPGNRALAVSPKAQYARIRVTEVGDTSLAVVGEEIVVAAALIGDVCRQTGIAGHDVVERFSGTDLAGSLCQHPLRGQGYDFDVPLLPADFVDMEQGTGFVHIAPGHGAEDFELGQANGIEVPYTVDEDGNFFDHVPLFAGVHVFKADDPVCEALRGAGGLLGRGRITHSYPHSWRSKAPLIFRNTPQWFIGMTENDLRKTALKAIDEVRWVPKSGYSRIYSMVEQRPEWVISRQRAWGVPITVFVDKKTGEPLRDEKVNQRIVETFGQEGADAWFTSGAERFLGPEYDPADYDKVDDIVDVWFESGSTHSFVLEVRDDLSWPASLYLEGSDQHRGWFHSSLLESCGTRGRAPYDAVLTHGFVLDEHGRKMSKSLGNVVGPQEIMDRHGADILRLWVVSSDFTEDLRIGPEIIKTQVDAYRKLRNTLRFLLGNLAEFDESERVPASEMPELERWVLHRLCELDRLVRRSCDDFDFHRMFVALYNFCTVDLSALYFDIRKDSLYCDRLDSPRRRAARTVLDTLFDCLTAWFAPVLCFTAEEAWLSRNPGEDDSVHLRTFPSVPEEWRDDALARKWEKIRNLRRVVTGALEVERQEKRIGSSLQSRPRVHVTPEFAEALEGLDLGEIAITSGAELVVAEGPGDGFRLEEVAGVTVVPDPADGTKCERCWQVLVEVGDDPVHPDLCRRCGNAVDAAPSAVMANA